MNYLIQSPPLLKGTISLPSSKSISNRVLIINALSQFPSEIRNLSDCDDTEVMLQALKETGTEINIKAAGTAMRFLTAYFSGKPGSIILTGTERMKNRPVRILVDALHALGAEIQYLEKDGFPPLMIQGKKLQGGDIVLDSSVSSQYISALLMAAPLMTNGLCMELRGEMISRPYLQLTIQLMRQFGVIVFEDGRKYTVPPQQYTSIPFTVESDWSAASYWYQMVALSTNAEVELAGLFSNSLQGDAAIVSLFDQLGVHTTFINSGVRLKRKERIACNKMTYDFVDIPDMAQTFVVTCALLNIPFYFEGLQSLKIKETDRITALCTELKKFGYLLTERNGRVLEWNGERVGAQEKPIVDTYEDHRMAMAFAPMAFHFQEGVRIANAGVVSKSYPAFWDDLRSVGFKCIET